MRHSDKGYRASIAIHICGVVGTFSAAAVYFLVGIKLLAAYIVFAGILFGVAVIVYRKGHSKTATVISLVGVSIVTLAGDIFLGIGCGAHYFLLVSVMFFVSTDRTTVVFRYVTGLLCIVEFAVVCIFLIGVEPIVLLPSVTLAVLDKVNLLIAFGAICFTMFHYSAAVEDTEALHRQYNSILMNMANTDQLTGLPNRRSAYQVLNSFSEASNDTEKGFVIGLADIDDFKRLNDTYGHYSGDDILVRVGAVLKSALRENDFLGRWGGEEFLIILPDTTIEDGLVIMNRLKEILAKTTFSCGDHLENITVTIGVTAYTGTTSILELVQQADERLYKGKSDGKNCVVRY